MPWANFNFQAIPIWIDESLASDEFYFCPVPDMHAYQRRDRMIQGLLNNLWDNNPGEIDRWENEGGR